MANSDIQFRLPRRHFLLGSASAASASVVGATLLAPKVLAASSAPAYPGATDAGPPSRVLGPTLKFQHVTFVVKDIEASVAWWKEKLGFKEWLRAQPKPPAKPFAVLLRCGGVCIELLDGSKSATGVTKPGSELTGVQGFCQTSWVVDDAEACRQTLVKLGVQVWQHPPGMLLKLLGGPEGLGPNLNMCFFWDLDGNEFELWSGQVAGGVFSDGKVIERF